MAVTPSPAVLRACDLLDHLAQHVGTAFTVSELARRTGVPRATCNTVLLALVERGLVVRHEPELRYTLGPACIAIGDAARESPSLVATVTPVVEELARSTAQCIALVVHSGGQARIAAVIDHAPALGMSTRAGLAMPLVPPFGAVFVAWAGQAAETAWLDRLDSEVSAKERKHYQAALQTIRQRGYSVTLNQHGGRDLSEAIEHLIDHPDSLPVRRRRDQLIREMVHTEYLSPDLDSDQPMIMSQMSAPVFDHFGRVAMSITMLGPTYQLTATELASLGRHLLAAARTSTELLRGRWPD